jgi:hypothetical protein
MSNYKIEFPRFTDPFPEIDGFYDSSWHNDACPSLAKNIKENQTLYLFVNYSDEKRREIGDFKYFVLYDIDGGESTCLLQTDDLDHAKHFLNGFLKGIEKCTNP